MADTDWTDEELSASIRAYLHVHAADEAGVAVSPTQVFRSLIAGPLAARSEGAIGRRMSNLSSVFAAEGLAVARRFKGSLDHVGPNVARRVLRLHAELIAGEVNEPTDDDTLLKARTRLLRGKQTSPPRGNPNPGSSEGSAKRYKREAAVCAWVLDRANGVCEACEQRAPFTRTSGEPYLEVHHLVQIAHKGPDTVENAIAACPNCHRRLHYGSDRDEYRQAIYERWIFLRRPDGV